MWTLSAATLEGRVSCGALENEIARLKTLVAKQTLDMEILTEAAKGSS